MGFWEGLCLFATIIILGFYGLIFLGKKFDMIEEETKETFKKEEIKLDKPKKERKTKDKKETK